MEGLILAWTGLLGACVGSFTNVVAWRLPRQESVVFPGSHCPKCGHAIRWHDNLPLIALLLPLVLIDLDHPWLPEPLCRWGVVLGLLVSTAAGIPVLASHLIAAVLALLLLEGLSALAERLFREPWLEAPLASVAGWAPGNHSRSVPSLPWASGWSG